MLLPKHDDFSLLRRAFSAQVRQALKAEVEKDYVKMPVDEIARHLAA